MEFRWNEWNREHATRHGVGIAEIERVVEAGRPRQIGDDKLIVIGRGTGGRFIQAFFVLDDDGTVYVIHARPLTDAEKRRYRRRK